MYKKIVLSALTLIFGTFICNIQAQNIEPLNNASKDVELYILGSDASNKNIENKNSLSNRKTSAVFTSVEQMPQFPGGAFELLKFLAKNFRYPADAVTSSIQGRVIIRFVIDAEGRVRDAKIIRSLEKSCDEEALRVINSMPNWIPGQQNGQNVCVFFTIPIVFKLTAETIETIPTSK